MKIYFVRHGQTEWNRTKKLQGQANLPLNEQGIRDARRAAEILREIPFDAIYCSPLTRTVETANIIGACQEASVVLEPQLIEIAYGQYEGYDLIAAEQDPACEIYRYFHSPQDFQAAPDGETLRHLKERCQAFLTELRRKDAGKCVLAVSHGTFIRGVISVVCGLSDADFWKGKEQGNCAITIVEEDREGWVLRADAVEALEEAERA